MTKAEIEALYRELKVPANIVDHMKRVASVAYYLGGAINRSQGKTLVDTAMTVRAALLHDILKLHKNHEEAAARLLEEKGYASLAGIVRKTAYRSILSKTDAPATLEEKITYYADKRVLHDRIVTLAERLADGRRRYFPHGAPPDEKKTSDALARLETELLKLAKQKPEDITEQNVPAFDDQFLNAPPPRR